jgi:FkbM family methyltransferase
MKGSQVNSRRLSRFLPLGVKLAVRGVIDRVAEVQLLGLHGAVDYWRIMRTSREGHRIDGLWRIHVKGCPGGVAGRYSTSDLAVFRQIFVQQEYAWAHELSGPAAGGLIIDCGANVGYTTVYLLRLFAGVRVVAIEPDASNFDMLELNLRRWQGRARAIKAGVWSRRTRLVCGNFGEIELQHWGRQVRECDADTPDSIAAVTIGGVLAESGYERISLLKVDIEGAEVVVFGDGSEEWLGRTDAIGIELHDKTPFGPATDVFHEAIRSENFSLKSSGELTIAIRRQSSGRFQEGASCT